MGMRRVASMVGLAGLALDSVAMGTVSAQAAGSGWGPPQALSSARVKAYEPLVAAAANGDAAVIWRQILTTGVVRIMASSRNNGGSWGAPMPVSGGGTKDKTLHQVAMNAHTIVVVWESARHIWVSRKPESSGWTRPVSLAEVGYQSNLAVAIDRPGDISVVWPQDDAVMIVRRPASGHWGHPSRMSGPVRRSRFDVNARVAMDARGDTTVSWLRGFYEDDHCIVMAARRGAAAAHWSRPIDLGGGCYGGGPRLAMNPRGDTAATWQNDVAEGTGPFVQAAVRPAGGGWQVSTLGGPPMADESLGGVGLDDTGNATVAWETQYGNGFKLLASRRPVGKRWGVPRPAGATSGVSPEVATGGEGTTTIVWTRFTDGVGYGPVLAVQRPPAGPWGSDQTLSTGSPVDLTQGAQVAMDRQGHTVVVWSQVLDHNPQIVVATS